MAMTMNSTKAIRMHFTLNLANMTKQAFTTACVNRRLGIMIDVDGVLKLGGTPISKAKEAIELLRYI